MSIRAIIFDFGGVISTDDDLTDIGRFLAKKYKVNPKILDEITLRGWLKARIHPKYDDSFWNEVAKTLKISKIQLHDEYLEFPQLVPEIVDLIKQLQKKYVIAMLSNQISSWHQTLMKMWKLEKYFHLIITSYGEGVAKPDPKIYKRLIKKTSRCTERMLVYRRPRQQSSTSTDAWYANHSF